MRKTTDTIAKTSDKKHGKKAPLAFRLLAAAISPVVFILLFELILWLCGYGSAATFFVPWTFDGQSVYLPNPHYCEHFVPKVLSRAPESSVLYPKDDSTFRIFVLGGSAANGDPDPGYGFCRQLEILLNAHSEQTRFEVINAAVTAMNSHVARRIAQDCADHDPDLFIVYMGNNEVVGPYGPPTMPESLYPYRPLINTSITLQKDFRLGQLIKNSVEHLRTSGQGPRQWQGMESFLESKVAHTDNKLKQCYRHFQANLKDIVTTAHSSGAQTLLCTVPTNIADCAPFESRHKAGLSPTQLAEWDRLFEAGRAKEKAGEYEAALTEYESARAIDDMYADLAFCMGRCLLALDRIQEARSMLNTARDLDVLRFRADSRLNSILRQSAKTLAAQDVTLLDLERSLEADRQGKPLGDDVLVDHVHLNVHGNFRIALSAMGAIRDLLPEAQLRVPEGTQEDLFAQCSRRMLFDINEAYRLAMLMYARKVRPPFTDQLDHETDLTAFREDLIQLRGMANQAVEGESPYAEAVQQSPLDALLVRRYGDYLLRHQRVTEAIEVYQTYLEQRPFEASVRKGLAEAYADVGARDKALTLLTEPDAPFALSRREALEWAGGFYVQRGRYADAGRVFQELYRIDPRDVQVLINIASAALQRGDLAMTRQYLDRVLKIAPDSVPAMVNMGNYYVKQGETEEAHGWFERAVAKDPYNYIPQFNLGMQKLNLGKVSDGVKHITESVILKPDFVQGYVTLIEVYTEFDRPDTAHKYEQLRELFSP